MTTQEELRPTNHPLATSIKPLRREWGAHEVDRAGFATHTYTAFVSARW